MDFLVVLSCGKVKKCLLFVEIPKCCCPSLAHLNAARNLPFWLSPSYRGQIYSWHIKNYFYYSKWPSWQWLMNQMVVVPTRYCRAAVRISLSPLINISSKSRWGRRWLKNVHYVFSRNLNNMFCLKFPSTEISIRYKSTKQQFKFGWKFYFFFLAVAVD